ncbi:hypothetical protein [Aquamicrobium sp.]|uniref:hypothetical protein n=1 Tax=Aquamicrobium sp. TaxID=1872579 RepID=UPI00258E7E1A|nr:hypothetical protein [Aquamicrobium sp.]MCK9552338.1 hypothetical protein [Aquamicrobium sp.]
MKKELIQQTFENNLNQIGLKIKRVVRGKGFEIVKSNRLFASSWSMNLENGKFHKDLLHKINSTQTDISELVINEFYDKTQKRYLKQKEFPLIEDILSGVGLKNCSEIRIEQRFNEVLGYIPASKYDMTDIKSIYQLIKDCLSLEGYDSYDEMLDSSYDDFSDTIEFKEENGWSNGYTHIHGELIAMDSKSSDIIDQNWRVDNYNDSVIQDFWDDELGFIQEYLKEIDPNDDISVYTYKGKKGHIGYSLKTQECYFEVLDDDGETEEEYAKFAYWKKNPELLKKVCDIFTSEKRNIEVKGYISNELKIGSFEKQDYTNNDDIFNFTIIDKLYDEDEYSDFAQEIIDLVNFDDVDDSYKSANVAVQNAYDAWLGENIVGKKDDGLFEDFRNLVMDSGYQLLRTLVPGTKYMQNCVMYKSEEYHFSLYELFAAKSANEFFTMIQTAISKRLLEKLQHSVLIEKSSHVFVGLEDSLDSGNCNTGTMAFCHRHGIDTKNIGGIRGDVILSMEFTNFTRRAVMQAIVKHSSAAA